MGGSVMSKISRPLLEYREVIKSTGITIDQYSPPRKTMKRFIRLFREIEDTRVKAMTDYPLEEILVIAFLAVLGNASGWNEIERFGNAKHKWLRKFLKLENGIPSHDTFRRVFSLIDPQQLEKATVLFLIENMDAIKKSLGIKTPVRQLCIDGKEERGTGRKSGTTQEIRNLQTLHIYDASNGICLVSHPIDSKTNEIPAAQEALKMLQLKHAIVTFDALHTQIKTIGIIMERDGNYVGALKGNQENLAMVAAESFSQEDLERIHKGGKNYYETIEKSHSQVETRRFYMTRARLGMAKSEEWRGLRNFICYEKQMYSTITGEETTETRYYITSLNDVELCADAIRGHWSVENQLHWHLDYTFHEDDNTTVDRQAFTNLSILNKMALSLFKLVQPLMKKNSSIRLIRKDFSWGFEDNLSKLLNSFDEKVLRDALENPNTNSK